MKKFICFLGVKGDPISIHDHLDRAHLRLATARITKEIEVCGRFAAASLCRLPQI